MTPLYVACEAGQTEIVNLLLAYGGNANQQARDGRAPIHIAAENGWNQAIVSLLEVSL